MHARRIIQKLLEERCPGVHAKRAQSVAALVQAALQGGLSLMGLSRHLDSATPIRHRIKRCDRLLGNRKLYQDREIIYGTLCRLVVQRIERPVIIVDWSDVNASRSQQLLRAALMIKGRALTLYEEIHPLEHYAAPQVHQRFIQRLKSLLPETCQPIVMTDAGFRAPWFKLISQSGWDWIGRIRNRDSIRSTSPHESWQGCKSLYEKASKQPQDLGQFDYVRSNAIRCRLVLIKKPPAGRHAKSVFGQPVRSKQSLKHAQGQREPWLLAVSPTLSSMSADKVVACYRGRMQIEQTFRDIKNAQFGLGLSQSQTRDPLRFSILLLIGALAMYALWIIGLTAQHQGFKIQYGSRHKAEQTLSILSLALWWMREAPRQIPISQINQAIHTLRSMAIHVVI
jgi:hypothetical protein